MMKTARTSPRVLGRAFLLAGFLAAGLASCTDAPSGTDEQIPVGLVVLDASGGQVASFNGSAVSGGMQVRAGGQGSFRVVLTSAGGGSIGIGSRYTLSPTVVIAPLASVSVSGSDRMVITGHNVGTTSVVVRVLDGGSTVFSPAIPLTVN